MGFSSGSYNSHVNHIVSSASVKGAALLNGSIYGTSYGEKIVETGKTEDAVTALVNNAVATA